MLPVVGLFCECCAASACNSCYKVANKKYRCKQITWTCQKPFLHQWVNGKLSFLKFVERKQHHWHTYHFDKTYRTGLND